MILQRVLMAIAAAAAVAAAAVIAMVALSLAVFGLLRPWIGSACAAASVAALYALLIGLIGLMAARAAGGGGRGARESEHEAMGLADRLMELAREKPIAAVGVALALGIILMRSPKSLGAIAGAFFDSLSGGRASDR